MLDMYKVLVTGVSVGTDVGVCSIHGFDVSWLFKSTSSLIWADKILITESIWRDVTDNRRKINGFFDESVHSILNECGEAGIFEVVRPKEIFKNDIVNVISNELGKDLGNLKKQFPKDIQISDKKNIHGGIVVNGVEYCSPHLVSLYASLLLSKALNATCLLQDDQLNYLQYKSKLESNGENRAIPFQEVFSTYLPNKPLISGWKEEKCKVCLKRGACLSQTRKYVKEILSWRDYDEVCQLKEVVAKILETKNQITGYSDLIELQKSLHDEKIRWRKRILKVFPKIERFTCTATIVSVPFALFGLATGNSIATVYGAGVLGVSQIINNAIKVAKSNNNWALFFDKLEERG